jgi:hypothetical protein
MDADLGRYRVVGFDPDHGELAGRALGKRGAGPVSGEHVRVAVAAEGRVGGIGVIPGPSGQLHDAGPDVLGERDAGQAAAAVVEDADARAVGDAPGGRVARIHRGRLAAADLALLAVGADVELTVQTAAGLVGHQLEGIAAGVAAEPFGRLEPDRMPGAVGVTEAVDGRREDLDLPARRAQSGACRVAAEGGEQHLAGIGDRDFQRSGRPELLERRHLVTCGAHLRAPSPVQVTQPLARGPAFGEGRSGLQPLRQGGEDGIVIARLRIRFGQLRHGEQGRVAAADAEIVAFDRHRRGQHDVRVPRGGGPERVVDHHGLRPGERLAQPGEVLVVMERVPAGPVDALDVRVAAALPVVVVAIAGMQQHVRDPGHRDVGVDAVRAL